jgi:hypothetical protein
MPAGGARRPTVPLVARPREQAAPPAAFARACAALRAAAPRRDVSLREVPAPGRVAPWSLALAAELVGNAASADGRFVVLHDPAGQEGWRGDTRVVVFARADLDEEMVRDPLLPEVTWSWLLEALDGHGAGRVADRGTVTTTVSRRFGDRAPADEPGSDDGEVELRCSWTPVPADDLLPHLAAFCDLLALTAGVPPFTPGVVPLRP